MLRAAIRYKNLPLTLLTYSRAAKGDCRPNWCWKLKHLSQGTMAARPCEAEEAQNSKMRKSPLRGLGTKSLTGSAWAILCKACHALTPGGIVVACLVFMMNPAAAQPTNMPDETQRFLLVLAHAAHVGTARSHQCHLENAPVKS